MRKLSYAKLRKEILSYDESEVEINELNDKIKCSCSEASYEELC